MNIPFLFHGQTDHWVTRKDNQLTLTLAVDSAFPSTKILVRHEPDNEEVLVEMRKVGKTDRLDYWQARIPLNQDRPVTHYLFKVLYPKGQWWLDARSISARMPGRDYHFKYNAQHQPPEWVYKQVFYQIFPDRFANGDPDISVKNGEYALNGGKKPVTVKTWGAPVDTHQGNGASEFYGGDLYGVEAKLDYLQTLGITALYLNPIFHAPSNHKYDCMDYYTIDPHLGSNEHFAQLCQNLHQRDMKVILDAVFNHTSTEHPWFNLQGWHPQCGAYQSVDSPYRDYYFFNGDGQEYIGWKGIASLPVLNFQHPEVKATIYQAEDAVIKYWLKPPYQIDGWWFDVIHMLGEGEGAKNNAHYVKAFREAAKLVNPESYVLGEHFFEATQWLQGDQEDGAMNYYGFAHPLRALLTKLDIAFDPIDIHVPQFLDWLMEARAKIPWANQLAQLNQLDSHDTARFLELVSGDQALFKIASTLLFTYVGTPCLYYGTEVGLRGSHDPDNRRCMPWERVETSPYFAFFQQLIALRKESTALQKGNFYLLYQASDCFVFARQYAKQAVIVGINLGEQCEVTLPLWQLGLSQGAFHHYNQPQSYEYQQGEMKVNIPARHSTVLIEHE
ncbi:maltodextrin glucosidase [Vibrio cincinnatiensis]|uniref:maltodextrin glucosidase n=1 Tax=Vibrio cincinnatiensis TaxID=675 RepID=UPI001EDFAD84|nr:maltodextrin glucosidase [Vibrio cincinnatiensis]MCG3743669.1 maltodextrin glucosidase [Vibrio cincinnatiensis]